MNTRLRGLAHRLRGARTVARRAELAVTGVQVLFWMALIGVVAGLALRLKVVARATRAQVYADPAIGKPTKQAIHQQGGRCNG